MQLEWTEKYGKVLYAYLEKQLKRNNPNVNVNNNTSSGSDSSNTTPLYLVGKSLTIADLFALATVNDWFFNLKDIPRPTDCPLLIKYFDYLNNRDDIKSIRQKNKQVQEENDKRIALAKKTEEEAKKVETAV